MTQEEGTINSPSKIEPMNEMRESKPIKIEPLKIGKTDDLTKYTLTGEIPSVEFYWVNRKPTSYGWMGKVLMDV